VHDGTDPEHEDDGENLYTREEDGPTALDPDLDTDPETESNE
jgi:hypothetical protein